jgi:signal transduction histidine kinase
MPTESRPAARRRPRAGDGLAWCAAALYAPALLALAVNGLGTQLSWALLVLIATLPMGLLRRRPVPALLLMLLTTVAVTFLVRQNWYGRNVQIVLMITVSLAVGCVAAARPRRVSVPAALFALVTGIALTLADPVTDLTSLLGAEALAAITAWTVGDSVRQRRQYAAAQREQAEARAVQAERLRIARELHDMIAHSIGVIAIQAGMGRRVIDTQPAEARDALTAIEDTSRDTLAALRRMLGTLRRADPGTGPAPLDPTPGLADLDGLVARTRDAGLRVDVRWRGDRRPLPPDIDLSAFRVIQEAVTNVIRHAGTEHCDVVVDQRTDSLAVEITDAGRGGGVGPGYGISGMRERVGLLAGEFEAGPRAEGGFRVAARIPVPS